jgi:hypothetical protein
MGELRTRPTGVGRGLAHVGDAMPSQTTLHSGHVALNCPT